MVPLQVQRLNLHYQRVRHCTADHPKVLVRINDLLQTAPRALLKNGAEAPASAPAEGGVSN